MPDRSRDQLLAVIYQCCHCEADTTSLVSAAFDDWVVQPDSFAESLDRSSSHCQRRRPASVVVRCVNGHLCRYEDACGPAVVEGDAAS